MTILKNSFNTKQKLLVDDKVYEIYNCNKLSSEYPINRLPFTHKILLENLLRFEDGINVTSADIRAVAEWDAKAEPSKEISFTPARVLMQDFTGVPICVDLAAMRDAVIDLGGNPDHINPLLPAELVIDHSVQVDVFGTPDAATKNAEIEFSRNKERYGFLRWGNPHFQISRLCHQIRESGIR